MIRTVQRQIEVIWPNGGYLNLVLILANEFSRTRTAHFQAHLLTGNRQ